MRENLFLRHKDGRSLFTAISRVDLFSDSSVVFYDASAHFVILHQMEVQHLVVFIRLGGLDCEMYVQREVFKSSVVDYCKSRASLP